MVIPGTQGGNSSQYYDMVKVNSTDIAVVYYDQTAENLKLAYSSNAWDTKQSYKYRSDMDNNNT